MNRLNIVKIQRFSTHDGPGVRTVVFVKGCPMRCVWCHNPETQFSEHEVFYRSNACIHCHACEYACKQKAHEFTEGRHIFLRYNCIGCHACTEVCPSGALEAVGKYMTVEEIMAEVLRDRAFYGSDGGLTVSGGEPMMQPRAVIELLSAAKAAGLHTAVETCGLMNKKYLPELVKNCDLFLWDLKDGDSERHNANTGYGNESIIKNLFNADRAGAKIVLRCIMIKGVNMDRANFDMINSVSQKLEGLVGVELIPYHPYGSSKYRMLAYFDGNDEKFVPTERDMKEAREYIRYSK